MSIWLFQYNSIHKKLRGFTLFSTQYHYESTGEHHKFKAGIFTYMVRYTFQTFFSSNIKKRIAKRIMTGIERVAIIEKETAWLKKHGSPQRVLGLPEHASLAEIRNRYLDLLLETHPDITYQHKTYLHEAEQMLKETKKIYEHQMECINREKLIQKKKDDEISEFERKINSASLPATLDKPLEPEYTMRIKIQPEAPSFELVREAYAIIINPNSAYYLNGSDYLSGNSVTQGSLRKQVQLYTRTTSSNLSSTQIMGSVAFIVCISAIIFIFIMFNLFWETLFSFVRPDLYKSMIKKERDAAHRRSMGEEVNEDPMRIAPKQLLKLMRPGLFIHEDNIETIRSNAKSFQPSESTIFVKRQVIND